MLKAACYAKMLELCPERIPEIHTTQRLKPPFITSGFKYSPHRQTNSQKTPGKDLQPCPFSQGIALVCYPGVSVFIRAGPSP